MKGVLSAKQEAARVDFRAFVDAEVVPFADAWHRAQRTPPEMVRRLGARGLLGLSLPAELGGGGCDAVTAGLLAEEVGRGCSSLRSLLTVHPMAAQAILRFGSREQKEAWLGRLARGEAIAAFALSEPGAGSDAAGITTTATLTGDEYELTGEKKWITYGQIADVFLLFARVEDKPTAFLVERERPGVRVEPMHDLLGLRASMTARVVLEGCRVPRGAQVGRVGLGVTHVAAYALDYGRAAVAWGAVGVAQACLDACVLYATERRQFGVPLKQHQLVRRMLTDMATDTEAARLLCLRASLLRDARDPDAIAAASMAKYFAARAAARAASDAVQLHGANGCGPDFPTQRYLGDAKVLEIIEGSTQIHQIGIAEHALQEYAGLRARRSAAAGPLEAER